MPLVPGTHYLTNASLRASWHMFPHPCRPGADMVGRGDTLGE